MEEQTQDSPRVCGNEDVDDEVKVPRKERRLADRTAQTGRKTSSGSLIKRRLVGSPKKNSKSPKKRRKVDESVTEESADEEEWEISKTAEEERNDVLTDVANELAEKIESKNINLSAANVKSILHHLLTDKLLVEFTQRVALDASDNDIQASNELGSEVRITRSKWKGRKAGDTLPQPKVYETELEEDSEDEEYDPDKENSLPQSDDESIATSFSDQPSPFLATTPGSTAAPQKESETVEVIEQGTSEPADNTFKVPVSLPSSSQHKHYGESTEEKIAYRTRSKISMRELSLDALTEALAPPDFDPALYEFHDPAELDPDDLEWQSWLTNLFKQDELDESMEDNDEDFNFMAIEEEFDKEEFRTDKGVRITHKELEGLLDGFLDDFGENIKDQSTILKYVIPKVSMTQEQKFQLSAQLQQHVQLLTQSYILSYQDQLLTKENQESRELLTELARFRDAVDSDENLKNNSAYYVSGLQDALRIIDTIGEQLEVEKKLIEKDAMPAFREAKTPNSRGKRVVVDVPPRIALRIFIEPFFMTYPELLPEQGVMATERLQELSKEVLRLKFFRCEDNLLAMGLVQFGKNFEMISKHLLPVASPKQLYTRTKNLVSKREDDKNPVKVLRRTNCLPPLTTDVCINFPRSPSTRPLKDTYHELSKRIKLPLWVDKIHKLLSRLESGGLPKVSPPQPKPAPVSYPIKFRPIFVRPAVTEVPRLEICRIVPPKPVVKKKPPRVRKAPRSRGTKVKTVSTGIQTEQGDLIEPVGPANDGSALGSLDQIAGTCEEKGKVEHDIGISCALLQGKDTLEQDNTKNTIFNESATSICNDSSGELIDAVTENPPLVSVASLQSGHLEIGPEPSSSKMFIRPENGEADLADEGSDDAEKSVSIHTTAPVINNDLELCLEYDTGSSPMQSNLESGNCSLDDDTEDYEDSQAETKQSNDDDASLKVCTGAEGGIGSDDVTFSVAGDLMEQKKGTEIAEEGSPEDKDSPKERNISKTTTTTRRKKMEKNENFNWEEKLQEKASKFADLYFEKVKETLADKPDLYCDFLRLIDEAGRQKMDRVEVYWKLSDLLSDFPELIEMFVGFLEPSQARDVGKFKTWLEFDKARNFLLSCEAFFLKTKHYHQLLRKKIRLHECESDSRKIVESIKTHFRGNNDLITELSTILPDLTPPRSRSEDFEVIRYRPDQDGFDHVDEFEEVRLKPSDCFDSEDAQQKKKNMLDDFAAWLQRPALNAVEIRAEKHDGRKSDGPLRSDASATPDSEGTGEKVGVVEQTPLGTKSVPVPDEVSVASEVQFSDSSVINRRPLTAQQQTFHQTSTVIDRSSTECHGEGGESVELVENHLRSVNATFSSPKCSESGHGVKDAPGRDSKLLRTPVTSCSEDFKSPVQLGNTGLESRTNEAVLLGGSSPIGTKLTTFRLNVHQCSPGTGFQRIGPTKKPTDSAKSPSLPVPGGPGDSTGNTSAESCSDSRKEVPAAGPEDKADSSDCVSADDLIYDSDGNIISKWTRDDDRIILVTCQASGASDATFGKITEMISGRTKKEVQDRFFKLMKLLTTASNS